MTSESAGDQQVLQAAWQRLLADWGDERAHRRFIALSASRGALDEAARRYREVRTTDPARADVARRQLDAVLAAAWATLGAPRPPTKPRRSRLFWLVCGVSLGLCGYVILSVLRLLGR